MNTLIACQCCTDLELSTRKHGEIDKFNTLRCETSMQFAPRCHPALKDSQKCVCRLVLWQNMMWHLWRFVTAIASIYSSNLHVISSLRLLALAIVSLLSADLARTATNMRVQWRIRGKSPTCCVFTRTICNCCGHSEGYVLGSLYLLPDMLCHLLMRYDDEYVVL